jgi:release factor glutamine methyltransferase
MRDSPASPNPLVRDLLRWATSRLSECLRDAPFGSGDTPYLDSLLLLSFVMGEPTERLLASFADPVDEDSVTRFLDLVATRCRGIPVSYIRGIKEFYGREFVVSPAVLVPRPDSEILVETVVSLVDEMAGADLNQHVHDACTGSGCIAITIAAERPGLVVSASDVDPDALRIAALNRDRLLGPAPSVGWTRLHLWESDFLSELRDECDQRRLDAPQIITANPPYLTDTEYGTLRAAHWPEPEHALRGGRDGLDPLRGLAVQAVTALPPGGYLVVEIGPEQAAVASDVLVRYGFDGIAVRKDLAERDRVIVARQRT